ncbi:serine/threonine-protein kinase gin4-related [Anaeramoeba ignava]|uniref:Serine/threonine-protein kinase gin4-related n=1 Tax=Anaeramoeba ignava TaxID=1746090 RepID=A0A9Q0LRY1_ANAIG|nr:serine/threonine-protein kinase gin4-related [Anaeramoeba ignava]
MEEGELFDYLVNKGRITHEEALCLFQQIIYGLEYCHNHLICHRDLKPENLLVDKKQNIKIADFGMARLINAGSLASTSCGSPHYASPEVVRGIPYDGMASDVWSCGVILYALLIGRLPFDDNNLTKVLQKVEQGVYTIPNTLSQNKVDLIQRMLTVDPKQRITISEIKKHPWFRSNFPDGYLPPSIASMKHKTNKPINFKEMPKEILSYLKSLGSEEPNIEKFLSFI